MNTIGTYNRGSLNTYYRLIDDTILEYLNTFGSCTREQTYFMLPNYIKTENIDRAVLRLSRQRKLRICSDNKDHYVRAGVEGYNENVVKALWILLVHKGNLTTEDVNDFWFARGSKPALISYILDGVMYEVIPMQTNNAAIMLQLQSEYNSETNEQKGAHRFIFSIEDSTQIDELSTYSLPCFYAKVNEESDKEPVTFFSYKE